MAADFKICPDCGTRNKAKWEFCVRCGETIVDVAPGEPAGAGPAPVAALPAESAGNPLATLAVLGVLVAGGYWAWHHRPAPESVDPGLFVGATLAPFVPPAPAYEPEPGERDLGEGRNALYAGNLDDALSRLAAAVGAAPGDPAAHYVYAQALWQSGSQLQAVGEYQEAARLAPESLRYQSDLAKALAASGQTAAAAQAFEAARTLRASPGVMRDLARLYLQTGRRDDGIAVLAEAVQAYPASAVIGQDYAYALEQAGRGDDAIAAYRAVLEVAPDAAVSRGRLAHLLFQKGRKDEAIGVVKAAVDLNPTLPLPHRDLGSLLERSGRPQEAAAEYREYARLAPNSEEAKRLTDRADRLAPTTRPAAS